MGQYDRRDSPCSMYFQNFKFHFQGVFNSDRLNSGLRLNCFPRWDQFVRSALNPNKYDDGLHKTHTSINSAFDDEAKCGEMASDWDMISAVDGP